MKKHSRFGIASCLIGVLNWGFIGLVVIDFRAGRNGFMDYLIGDGPVLGLFVIPFLLLVIPAIGIIGHVIGVLAAIVDLFQADCRRLFAVIGLIMNLIIPVSFLIGIIFLIAQSLLVAS